MKRWIHAATKTQAEEIYDLQNKIWDYIYNVLFEQNRMGYYKQVRKQLTVNGRKYIVKNSSPYNAMLVINPEGEELFKSTFPRGASRNDAKAIATDIINDAYGDNTDLNNKKVNLSVRVGYTSYGSNEGGPVVFGDYVNRLRKYYADDDAAEGRYFAVMIRAWWSSHDDKVVFSDDAVELIKMCQQFITDGAATPSPEGERAGYYRYYADVVDSETGKELYADKTESY